MNRLELWKMVPNRNGGAKHAPCYTAEEIAQKLGISVSNIYGMIRKHGIKKNPIMKKPCRYNIADFTSIIAKEKQMPTEQVQDGLYAIESGVPLPPKYKPKVTSALEIKLEQMKSGDSMLAKYSDGILVRKIAKERNFMVATRKTDDPDIIRVWRLG